VATVTEYAGRGDPARTLSLLWGRPTAAPTRGPKPTLTVEQIVGAAIALADEEGLDAVTMRKVGDRLGRSAMSLYTYVPSKHELLDLMLDAAQGELPTEYDLARGWRAATEAMARDTWAFYERHPWILHISGGRSTLGPHELDHYETGLRLLDGIGLTGIEMSRSVTALATFIGGAARVVADARAAEQATGMSDDEWWNARSPLLEELSSDERFDGRYPISSRLGAEEHVFEQPDRAPDDTTSYLERDALDAFEFGLQRLLDGIDALVDRSRPRRRSRS
jgi:AcrR family transcriptional regulator